MGPIRQVIQLSKFEMSLASGMSATEYWHIGHRVVLQWYFWIPACCAPTPSPCLLYTGIQSFNISKLY